MEFFLNSAKGAIRHSADQKRAEAILLRWVSAWQGQGRSLTGTNSNHGAYLHFNQNIGGTWCKAFSFHAEPKHGLSLRGPDTDRGRKSHRLRSDRLDPESLDRLFEAWSGHPEARPAGRAVELFIYEAHDDVWESFLQHALACLNDDDAL